MEGQYAQWARIRIRLMRLPVNQYSMIDWIVLINHETNTKSPKDDAVSSSVMKIMKVHHDTRYQTKWQQNWKCVASALWQNRYLNFYVRTGYGSAITMIAQYKRWTWWKLMGDVSLSNWFITLLCEGWPRMAMRTCKIWPAGVRIILLFQPHERGEMKLLDFQKKSYGEILKAPSIGSISSKDI